MHIVGHIGNVDETQVYFDMPLNVNLEENGVKTVLIRGTGNKKVRMTVMLSVLTNGCKLPPYVILL
jgi:hypothetical protein